MNRIAGFTYWAFLSYSHADAAEAKALARAIETYRLPTRLGPNAPKPLPKRLFPIFLDRDEFGAASDLPTAIEDALGQSRALIVLCSPAAKASPWVDKEISAFRRLHRDDRIYAALARGEPPDAFPSPETHAMEFANV